MDLKELNIEAEWFDIGLAEHTEPFKSAAERCKKANPGDDPSKCFAKITSAFKKAGKPIFVQSEAELVELKVTYQVQFDGCTRVDIEQEKDHLETWEFLSSLPEDDGAYVENPAISVPASFLEQTFIKPTGEATTDGWIPATNILRVRGIGLEKGVWTGIDGNTIIYKEPTIHGFAQAQLQKPVKWFHKNKNGETVGYHTAIQLQKDLYNFQTDVFHEGAAESLESGDLDGYSIEAKIWASKVGERKDGKPIYLAHAMEAHPTKGAAFVKFPACDTCRISSVERISLERETSPHLEVKDTVPNDQDKDKDNTGSMTLGNDKAPCADAQLEAQKKLITSLEDEKLGLEKNLKSKEDLLLEVTQEKDAIDKTSEELKAKLTQATSDIEKRMDAEWIAVQSEIGKYIEDFDGDTLLEGIEDRTAKKRVLDFILSVSQEAVAQVKLMKQQVPAAPEGAKLSGSIIPKPQEGQLEKEYNEVFKLLNAKNEKGEAATFKDMEDPKFKPLSFS